MKIEPIAHKSLAKTVAGKLAASLLDGNLLPGTHLPAERELMSQLGVSRATLREALKMLEESRLIESRPNVGWFAHAIDDRNLTKARELASAVKGSPSHSASNEPSTRPLRIPVAPEKPLHIPNLHTDRLGTFEFISWWEREKVQNG
jgi:DNA-binding GntR family transcriptional regulator